MAEAAATDQRLHAWLDQRGWQLFDFQHQAMNAYLDGASGLLHSATGSGKTLAAALGPMLEAAAGDGRDRGPQLLWVTPLRALASDLGGALQALAAELVPHWQVDLRTGDTPSSVRARQRRQLPQLLVTTPESLSLLLSYPDTVAQLQGLQAVVVDEWHELLGNKRGVLLELTLARLRSLAPQLRTWGLSATVGNVDEAAEVLVGRVARPRLIRGAAPRPIDMATLIPASLERFPWSGHIGLTQLDAVADAIGTARSTLVFCNTRAQAEAWFEALLLRRLELVDGIALHHGSLDRAVRNRVEDMLRDGRLRCVVATSSLDLGVDFAPVDQVIQIGGPKGVARLMQRAGRSGHGPGRTARLLCAPGHALEMLEFAAARSAMEAGRIEPRRPLRGCLDVLAQHLVTVSLGAPRPAAEVLTEIRRTHAFAELAETDWRWTLDFLIQGGPVLDAYPEYQRLEEVGGCLRVSAPQIARRHRMAIGTITADASMQVQFVGGARLGHVEESFIARLEPGQRFVFGGRVVELVRVRDMTAFVRRASGVRQAIPRWTGGRLPLSSELAGGVLALLEAFEAGATEPAELRALTPLLRVQQRWSGLPTRGRLLVERIRTRDGHHLFFYPFAGRLVHEGLSALVAWRLGQRQSATFTTAVNDYGFELLTAEPLDLDVPTVRAAFSPDDLQADILACMNAGELARRQFREISRIAGLVFTGYPGSSKSARQIQASSGLLFDVLSRHDDGHRLLRQAHDEVLTRELDSPRLREALAATASRDIVITEPERLTPLAFPLWADRIRSRLSTESWQQRVQRMLGRLEQAAE